MNERNGKTTRMVVDTVVNRIVNGVYLPGQNFGTEVSLANSFRVSRTTVRRAMKYLCDIGAVEKSPGSGFAVTLAPNCLKNVVRPRLLLIRAADSPLNNEICSGIMNAPEAHYYDISIIDATGNNGNYAAILRSLPQNIGNIMLFPLDIPEVKEEIIAAVERGIKLVQLDRCLEGVAAPSVMFDNYSGACAAVRHLLVEHSLPVYFAGSSYDSHWFKDCFKSIELVDRTNPDFPFVTGTMIRDMIKFGDNRWKNFIHPQNHQIIEDNFYRKKAIV